MTMQTVQVDYAGQIQVNSGKNTQELFAHQIQAIHKLDEKNQAAFEGLLVLPTSGGKTLTAMHWLLRNFINKRKKVLWIAPAHANKTWSENQRKQQDFLTWSKHTAEI